MPNDEIERKTQTHTHTQAFTQRTLSHAARKGKIKWQARHKRKKRRREKERKISNEVFNSDARSTKVN